MEKFTTEISAFMSNPWVSFGTFVIAVVGVVLTIVFFFKASKRKDPRYSIRSNRLVKDFIQEISGLMISFNDHPVSSLTVSKLAFWNKGKETLNFSDFSEKDPFKIVINSNYEILSFNIIFTTNEPSGVEAVLMPDKKTINVKFDFLDKDDGFIIQILHTGSIDNCLSVNGTIKGVGKISKRNINWEPIIFSVFDKFFKITNKNKNYFLRNKIKGWIIIITILLLIILFVNSLITGNCKKSDIIPVIIIILFYLPIGIAFVKPKVPGRFKDFYEIIE